MNEWIISSSILILAVLLVRQTLGRRIGLRLRYALWALVLVRLLVPVSLFDSSLSVQNLQRSAMARPAVQEFQAAVTAPIPVQSYESARAEVAADYAAQGLTIPSDTEADSDFESQVYARQDTVTVTEVLRGLWLGGMAVLGLILMGCNGHFALRLRRSRKIVEDAVCLLPVYESPVVPTPCIFGLFRPAVYLTPAVAGDLDARGHVLAHEMTHYRHLDHLWAVLRNVCLVLHWYNPLVWVAFRLSREDAELACDEGALLMLGEDQRGDYGRTLIRLTCGEGLTTGLIAATTMTGSARSIARRLRTLMKRRRTTVLALIAVVLAGAVAIGCTFSGAPAESTAPADSRKLTTDEGIIVYPGTAWGMTPEDVKTTLGLKHEDCVTYVDEIRSEDQAVYAFEAENQVFFGVSATVSFVFRSFTPEQTLALETVHVELESEADFDTVYTEIVAQLGEGEAVYAVKPEIDADEEYLVDYIKSWRSDAKVSDYATAEQWQLYLEEFGSVSGEAKASSLTAYDAHDGELPLISFRSNMLELLGAIDSGALTLTPEERLLRSCMALFEKDAAVKWYRAATTSLYDDPTQIHLGALFSDHLTAHSDLRSAELETLLGQYPQDAIDSVAVVRITVPEMRAVMEEYFGVSLDDCDLGTMEAYLYCAETEAYMELTPVPNAYDPEFSGGAVLENGDVVLHYTNSFYTKHYSDKICAITLRQKGEVWQIVSNRLIDPPAEEHTPTPDMSDHSQQIPIPDFTEPAEGALTSEQIDQVNAAFEPYIPMEEDPNGMVGNPICSFFNCYYEDVREMDLREFLRYCPLAEEATGEEYELLQQQENFPFTGTFEEMPVPLHRYPAEKVDALLKQYTGLGLRDRYEREESWDGLYYLAETDCYYNTTSDAGIGTFHCIGGQIYDGGVVELYSSHAVLTLRQEAGRYYIHSHRKLEEGTALTDEQIQQVRDAFAIVGADGELNPLASLVNQYYSSPELIDLEALIAYFPVDGAGTEEEYALFQQEYPDAFPEWPTLKDCQLPMHRYHSGSVDDVLRKYANITLDDLESKTGYYLEETDCYYNFTSDMGLEGFHCTGGMIYEDGVVLYSNRSALGLKKLGDGYVIDYHLPQE